MYIKTAAGRAAQVPPAVPPAVPSEGVLGVAALPVASGAAGAGAGADPPLDAYVPAADTGRTQGLCTHSYMAAIKYCIHAVASSSGCQHMHCSDAQCQFCLQVTMPGVVYKRIFYMISLVQRQESPCMPYRHMLDKPAVDSMQAVLIRWQCYRTVIVLTALHLAPFSHAVYISWTCSCINGLQSLKFMPPLQQSLKAYEQPCRCNFQGVF